MGNFKILTYLCEILPTGITGVYAQKVCFSFAFYFFLKEIEM